MRQMVVYIATGAFILVIAAVLSWSISEYRATNVSKSGCLQDFALPVDVSKPQFCECYVSKLSSAARRIYRVASKIRHGDLELHAAKQECTAVAFTPKPR